MYLNKILIIFVFLIITFSVSVKLSVINVVVLDSSTSTRYEGTVKEL